MTDSNKKKFDSDKLLLASGVIGLIIIICLALFAVQAYVKKFEDGTGLSNSQEVWGQFGDFIGGLVNPAIGMLTVFLLLISIHMQRRELKNSIEEMKTSNVALKEQIAAVEFQSIQQTFFTWLTSYREIVGGSHGREHLKERLDVFLGPAEIKKSIFESLTPSKRYAARLNFDITGSVEESIINEAEDLILKEWEALYKAEAHNIAGMFRTLYRLIKWIDEQDKNVLNDEQKYTFVSIARAQLSDVELIFMFYNGFTYRGKKFVYYINRYALFDNLKLGRNPEMRFLNNLKTSPYTKSAFKSGIAKRNIGIFPSEWEATVDETIQNSFKESEDK